MTSTTLKPGDSALDRDGHVCTIVQVVHEDGVDFAWIRYPDGHLPYPDVRGRVAGTEDDPVWEHRVEDGKVVASNADYWNPDAWYVEEGLRPAPDDETTPSKEDEVQTTTPTQPTLYPRPATPTAGSKTRRKDARRSVRTTLGPSADAAPGLLAALDALDSLRRIVDLASGGRYGVAIVRPAFDGEDTQTREVEGFTFGPNPGVVFTGERTREKSSQIHEPIAETRRRERHLRDTSAIRQDYA